MTGPIGFKRPRGRPRNSRKAERKFLREIRPARRSPPQPAITVVTAAPAQRHDPLAIRGNRRVPEEQPEEQSPIIAAPAVNGDHLLMDSPKDITVRVPIPQTGQFLEARGACVSEATYDAVVLPEIVKMINFEAVSLDDGTRNALCRSNPRLSALTDKYTELAFEIVDEDGTVYYWSGPTLVLKSDISTTNGIGIFINRKLLTSSSGGHAGQGCGLLDNINPFHRSGSSSSSDQMTFSELLVQYTTSAPTLTPESTIPSSTPGGGDSQMWLDTAAPGPAFQTQGPELNPPYGLFSAPAGYWDWVIQENGPIQKVEEQGLLGGYPGLSWVPNEHLGTTQPHVL